MGAADSGSRGAAHHAALAHRPDRRHPGVQERLLAHRRGDRHGRDVGGRGRAGGQSGRPAAADRLAAGLRVGARRHARAARHGRELPAVHGDRQRAGPVVEPEHRLRGHPRAALDQGGRVQAVLPARRAGRPPRPRPAAAAGGRLRRAVGGHGRRQALGGASGGRRQAGPARTGADPLQPALFSGRGDGRGRRGRGRRLVPPARLPARAGDRRGGPAADRRDVHLRAAGARPHHPARTATSRWSTPTSWTGR